jgi:hypothetical protein
MLSWLWFRAYIERFPDVTRGTVARRGTSSVLAGLFELKENREAIACSCLRVDLVVESGGDMLVSGLFRGLGLSLGIPSETRETASLLKDVAPGADSCCRRSTTERTNFWLSLMSLLSRLRSKH